MRKTFGKFAAATAALLGASLIVEPASAACTRLGFSVNDYGKDGPTKDAKELLDKYIAKWAKEHSIAKYTTGKKDVTCELFLNFILFDEHTCKAEASVCWDGPAVPGTQQVKTDASGAGDKPKTAAKAASPAKPESEKAAVPPKAEKAATHVETGSTAKAEAPATESAGKPAPATDAAKETTPPASEEKPASGSGQ